MSDRLYILSGAPVVIPVASASHPDTKTALAFWRTRAGDGIGPAWREIELLELPASVAPRVMVVDVISDPLDYRYRFFGTWHAACHKRDMTGRRVSEYPDPEYRTVISDEYSAVVMRRGPVLSLLSMTLNHVHYDCEILRLPLSDDGTAVSHILVVESLIATGP